MMRRQTKISGSHALVRTESASKGLLFCGLLIALVQVQQIAAQEQRPARHPAFGEGFRAFKQKDWELAVDRMLAAIVAWPEDGELTRTYGRWFEPYIPRYYLGVALLELGCYRNALHQLNETILNETDVVKGAKKQKGQLESMKLECEHYLRQGISESNSDCHKWNSDVERREGEELQWIES